MKVKNLTFCSICVALALVCSKIKIFSLPFGGSITLFSMLIISLPGYFLNIKYSLIAGVIYSFFKLILGGYIYSPLQAIIDYIFSYSAFALTGLSKNNPNKFILYFIIACIFRFILACISGLIFFIEYAPKDINPLLYVITYNGSYIFAEMILSIIIFKLIPFNKIPF